MKKAFRWIRPHIPEASDGILTSAGICEGFAGAGVSSGVLAFAGFAGLVAGTLAMGSVQALRIARPPTSRGTSSTPDRASK